MQQEFIHWLLDSTIPSIRYITLRDLLGRAKTDAGVQAAKQAIMAQGPVPAIFAAQTDNGSWAREHSYYTPKYVSTHWSMLLLTELEVEGSDPRFQRGLDYMLDATVPQLKQPGESNLDIACFWGNLLRYAAHGKRLDDPRVKAIIPHLIWDIEHHESRCKHNAQLPCAWGVARVLWSLAVLPVPTPETASAIETGLTMLLDSYQLVEANYPTSGHPHALWSKLSFPLFYQVDILFVLRTLADLHALHRPGAQAALHWLEAQRQADGHWQGTSPFRQRTWKALAARGDTDRWVSLQAALVLQQVQH
ncbi:MAG: hypothetical protein U0694_18360 [Anaerolineae bacterium]